MKRRSLLKNPWQFALMGGVFWGLALFLGTIIAAATGYGSAFLNLVGGIYPAYSISFSGAFVALFFGFIDGLIICYLITFFSGGNKKEKGKSK
jgi:hypothetical protein